MAATPRRSAPPSPGCEPSPATSAPGRRPSPGDAHAGRTETSLQLALTPGRVLLQGAVAGVTEPVRELLGALRAGGVAAVSPNGVLGDPSGASAGEGEQLLRDAVDALHRWIG